MVPSNVPMYSDRGFTNDPPIPRIRLISQSGRLATTKLSKICQMPLTRQFDRPAAGETRMHIIDSHFHWWPRSVMEFFCRRRTFPRAHVNEKGGYAVLRQDKGDYFLDHRAGWLDLIKQFEHLRGPAHPASVVCPHGRVAGI